MIHWWGAFTNLHAVSVGILAQTIKGKQVNSTKRFSIIFIRISKDARNSPDGF